MTETERLLKASVLITESQKMIEIDAMLIARQRTLLDKLDEIIKNQDRIIALQDARIHAMELRLEHRGPALLRPQA
jgi:hypothetical protein